VTVFSLITLALECAASHGQTPSSEPLQTRAGAAAGRPAGDRSASESDWPRVYIKDVYVRDAARQALAAASASLDAPKCQSLLSEFLDERGRPLTERLSELHVSPQGYLRLLILMDGETLPQCREDGVLAFTVPGSRIVYVCGRTFERASSRDPQEARATIIHESLHSLGLGERPPSPRHITDRVQRLCW
jgi:hypothetical protein